MAQNYASELDRGSELSPPREISLIEIAKRERCGRVRPGWTSERFCSIQDITYLAGLEKSVFVKPNRKTLEGNYRTDVQYRDPKDDLTYNFFTITVKPINFRERGEIKDLD